MPSPDVPRCAIAIESIFREAGVPDGIFQNLFMSVEQASGIIADERVKEVTLTGSDGAGRAVAAQAGEHLKKGVFELGGADPFIVLDDANLEEAVDQGITSRFMNAGQSCIAAKRFMVTPGIADEFLELFRQRADALTTGDPSMPEITLASRPRGTAVSCLFTASGNSSTSRACGYLEQSGDGCGS